MMSKKSKLWLLIATAITLCGLVLFTCVMSALKWNFKKLSTAEYQTKTYEITEPYQNISITTDTADILFKTSETTSTSVVCREPKKADHSVFVKDGELFIKLTDGRKWYDRIGVDFGEPKLTVYLPQGE